MGISFNKSKFVIVKMILLFSVAACMFSACELLPKAEVNYVVQYKATEGGAIIGETEQEVKYGSASEAVIAVANEGYKL